MFCGFVDPLSLFVGSKTRPFSGPKNGPTLRLLFVFLTGRPKGEAGKWAHFWVVWVPKTRPSQVTSVTHLAQGSGGTSPLVLQNSPFLKPDLVTQPPSAFAHGYLQSLPPFSGMPVQRNPRSSAGPTASGLPLEPQITIPLLSEQEAQDPAVPANVPQPFVAENKNATCGISFAGNRKQPAALHWKHLPSRPPQCGSILPALYAQHSTCHFCT